MNVYDFLPQAQQLAQFAAPPPELLAMAAQQAMQNPMQQTLAPPGGVGFGQPGAGLPMGVAPPTPIGPGMESFAQGALTPGMPTVPSQFGFAAPGAGYTPGAGLAGGAAAPQGETDMAKLMTLLGGGGGAQGLLGGALKPGDYRAPSPYMGGIGGKPQVQSQMGMPKHPNPTIQALLAYLGQGQR